MNNMSVLVLLFLSACGPTSGASIVGTWRGTITTGSTSITDITMTFSADGTLSNGVSGRLNIGGQYPDCTLAGMQSGTYTLSGDQLTINLGAATLVPANCSPQIVAPTVAASMQTARVSITATTLTVFAPDDAAVSDSSLDGGVTDRVVLTRQ